ncbi:sodium:solute symporter family protein [Methylogaea oryzae]|uniref:Sodium:solute symporter n=2 Tax=Methylogaea oryzae TaxID=1295382 RepID=A0A8D4VRY3_9GAMM|nr:sodium:solute symporter family protein [Methylogaea oryzae]BBL72756.1 sodium:solute symporter [Methylogaea oryzae]
MSPVLLGIVVYVAAQLAVGIVVTRRIRNESDYLLAGRSIGFGLGTFTVFATWFGAETCIGAAGAIYENGLSGGSADPFGYAVCLFLMALLFAVPLWRRGLTTLADLFHSRYSPGVERAVVLMLAPTSVMWGGAQIRALGQVLAASSALEVDIAITVAAAVVIAYTVYGGMLADVMTDLMQGIALIIGLGLLFYAVAQAGGGLQASLASIEPQRLRLFGGPDMPWLDVAENWAIPICGSVFAQELVARILASRSPETARAACLAGGCLYLAVGLIPVFIGLVGIRLMPGLDEAEQLLPQLALKHLPAFSYVLFAGAIISAILSTVDGALLAAAALVSHNLIVPLRPTMDDAGKVRTARAMVFVFGLVAYGLALGSDGVHTLVEEASAFGSAGVFTVALFALYTRRVGDRYSAYAALAAGMGAWLVGHFWLDLSHPYLISLGAALGGYLLTAAAEARLWPAESR